MGDPGGQDNNGVDDPGQDNKASPRERDNEGVLEPAARACRIKAQRLSHRAFLLAMRSNSFLAFSSSESVIG